MEELTRQVSRARRRLFWQQFAALLPWCLFGVALAAAAAMLVPRLWAWEFLQPSSAQLTWDLSWAGGAVVGSLALALTLTFVARRGALDAAIELDRRFGLRERVSSTLALTPDERETEAGRALIGDAVRRVERIDVKDGFGVSLFRWQMLLPLAPVVAAAVIAIFPLAAPSKAPAKPKTPTYAELKATEDQKKAFRDALRRAEEKLRDKQELKDAGATLTEIRKKIAQKQSGEGPTEEERKDLTIKINNAADDIKKQREKVGGADAVKKQLQRLPKLNKGPADKLADAVKEGDFKKAVDQVNQLQEKMKNGELNAEEKKQLGSQMSQMQDKLNEMKDAQQAAKESLKEQIEQAKAEGDNAKAGELQKELSKLKAQDQQMENLQDLADKLGKAADNLENGDPQKAAEQLQEIAKNLENLQKDLEELEDLDETLKQIADAKNAMNCEKCEGGGKPGQKPGQQPGQAVAKAQGQGKGDPNGKPGNNGTGEGPGGGFRPEQEGETGTFDSQVRTKPGEGEAVKVGEAGGPNRKGVTKEQISEIILKEGDVAEEAVPDQNIPRTQREHIKDYFDSLRELNKK